MMMVLSSIATEKLVITHLLSGDEDSAFFPPVRRGQSAHTTSACRMTTFCSSNEASVHVVEVDGGDHVEDEHGEGVERHDAVDPRELLVGEGLEPSHSRVAQHRSRVQRCHRLHDMIHRRARNHGAVPSALPNRWNAAIVRQPVSRNSQSIYQNVGTNINSCAASYM